MINKEFELLPDNEKRVKIAQDVIEQLTLNRIQASNGKFFKSEGLKKYFYDPYQSRSLQELLPNYQCQVCAMGALFVADVIQRNNFEIGFDTNYCIDGSTIRKKLNYFSPNQLKLIEDSFEGYDIQNSDSFYNLYTTAGERMLAIMNNIINNNGEFIPTNEVV